MNPLAPYLASAFRVISERVRAQLLFRETERISIYPLSMQECAAWASAAALTRGVN